MLRNPPASDWLMWRRTYNGWGYSPLDQINKDNVANLRTALDLVDDQRRHRDDADRA
jgi:glucose dehydrogenase